MLGRSDASAPASPDFFSSAFMIWNSSALAARKSAALAAPNQAAGGRRPQVGRRRAAPGCTQAAVAGGGRIEQAAPHAPVPLLPF